MDPAPQALDSIESPRKRIRLSSPESAHTNPANAVSETKQGPISDSDPSKFEAMSETADHPQKLSMNASTQNDTDAKERRVGIEAYVTADVPGFQGILKQRYTDFLVNEILPSGEVCHLKSLGEHYKRPRAIDDQGPVKERPKEHGQQKSGDANGVTVENDGQAKEDSSTTASGVATAQANGSSHKTLDVAQDAANATEPTVANSNSNAGQADKQASDQTKENEVTSDEVSDEDQATLSDLFGDRATAIIRLYKSVKKHPKWKAGDFTAVKTNKLDDRPKRTLAHQAVRRIFASHLETFTENDGSITVKAAPPTQRGQRSSTGVSTSRNHGPSHGDGQRKGKLGWAELGGEYLHFTLYKENKDTMEVVAFIASQLRLQPKSFQFAGTKDRRAVTVQKVSVRRVNPEQLRPIDRKLRNARIGDFTNRSTGLELGDLTGNEFCITLRECHFDGEEGKSIQERLANAQTICTYSTQHLAKNGFINYYGLQRFGSFAATTDEVGVKMLQGDFEGAVEKILDFTPNVLDLTQDEINRDKVSADDRARAAAINVWNTTKNGRRALDNLPWKFNAEAAIIRHLSSGKDRQRDFQGALSTISRNMRLMYVHAYQSLVWNKVATRRWVQFGPAVMTGDLVLVHEHREKVERATINNDTIDQAGEEVVLPAADDSATRAEDQFERARALSKEEANSGKYTIFDVVLPQPGWDVEYPANAIGDYYKEFMASEEGGGLDPHDMRRSWKEISLSGGYRKMLARPGPDISVEAKAYTAIEEQLVETDLERIKRVQKESRKQQDKSETVDGGLEEGEATETENHVQKGDEQKIAIVLKLQLGSSTYATMALRELMKAGITTYKPEFSGRSK